MKINKEVTSSVSYYRDVIEENNTGILKLIYPIPNIKNIEKQKILFYAKAYYKHGFLYKIEKYKTNKKIPTEVFFINNNNINYKIYKNRKILISCDLSYITNAITTKTIICSDGTRQIIKMDKSHLISDIKYNKVGTLIKKSIFTKGDIETFERKNGKMIKIDDEVE